MVCIIFLLFLINRDKINNIYWFVIPLIMYCPFTLLNILISKARIHMLILIEILLNYNLIRVQTNNTLHADELKCIWLKRFFCHFPCHSLYFVTWQIMHLLRMVMKYRFNWLHYFFVHSDASWPHSNLVDAFLSISFILLWNQSCSILE